MVVVVAHFLDTNLVNQSVVIGLKRMWYSHSAENIAQVIIPVLREMIDQGQLGCFVSDNENTNDAVIRLILAELESNAQSKLRRARCLGHIINLAAQAHQLANDVDCLEEDFEETSMAELFRQRRGFDKKVHGLVAFIRVTPQRREKFERCCVAVQADDADFKSKSIFIFQN